MNRRTAIGAIGKAFAFGTCGLWLLIISIQVHAQSRRLVTVLTKNPKPNLVVSSPSQSYLLSEGFEGTGYENTWSENGTIDEDYAVTSGEGVQSCRVLTGTLSGATNSLGGTYTELWGHFMVNLPDVTPSSELYFFNLLGATEMSTIRIRTTGVTRSVHNNAIVNGTAENIADNTWFRVWFHWKAETSEGAANGVFDVWTSAANVKDRSGGTKVITHATGAGFEGIERIKIYANPAITDYYCIFDQVIIDDSEFTTVP